MRKLEDLHGALKIYLSVKYQQWYVELKSFENSRTDHKAFWVGVLQWTDLEASFIQLQNFKEKMIRMLANQ